MSFLDRFKRKRATPPPSGGEDGISDEHLQLRRAIERCDNYKRAKDAGQESTLEELVSILKRNNFSSAVIAKAVAESWRQEVPKELLNE